jgi:inner membrane protein
LEHGARATSQPTRRGHPLGHGPLTFASLNVSMQKTLLFKMLGIGGLALLLLIPLAMIQGTISARQQRQIEVEQTIAASSAGAQTLIGPVLVVPYAERVNTKTVDEKKIEHIVFTDLSKQVVFTPGELAISSAANVETKYKGLYKVLLFDSKEVVRARFDVPVNLGLETDPRLITPGKAYIAIGISDLRGISGQPQITWAGKPLSLAQGPQFPLLEQGLHAEIGGLDTRQAQSYELTLNLNILGTGTLSYAPVGKLTSVEIKSPWPHPNFIGRFLPRQRSVQEDGFAARWMVTGLATKNDQILGQRSTLGAAGSLDTFGVTFIEPVNVYLQAERAVKYGILFVALTFAGFFLLETLQKLRIHPLQYALVGLALAIFFLLVISLSEHFAFVWAYLVAAASCVALLGYYLAFVLKSAWRGFGYALKFTLLYGILYGLLLSEDNALVLGSLVLFAALAAIMVLTRNMDWYEFGTNS